MRKFHLIRLIVTLSIGIASIALCIVPQTRAQILFLSAGILKGIGINKPELIFLPAALIIGWVVLDILAVFLGFWVFDRREAKRNALRRKLLIEEGLLPEEEEDKGAINAKKHPRN